MAKNKPIIDLQTGISILIGLVILSGLGFLTARVFNLGEGLADLKRLSLENKDRMNRIGDNIPQIKSVLATVEVEKMFKNALIAYQPQKDSVNNWNMSFTLAEISSSKFTSFKVALDSVNDDFVLMASSGKILNYKEGEKLSFYDFQKYSSKYVAIPGDINLKNSWIISGDVNQVSNLLRLKATEIKESQIADSIKDMQELIERLEDKQ